MLMGSLAEYDHFALVVLPSLQLARANNILTRFYSNGEYSDLVISSDWILMLIALVVGAASGWCGAVPIHGYHQLDDSHFSKIVDCYQRQRGSIDGFGGYQP